ncbi:MAG: DoxX family protein [Bacteroidetes bacterium]|nr:DoxX family protein [Bacteroidota bacterium]
MKESKTSHIAIILLAIVMAVFGIYHFVYPENLLSYVPSFLPNAGNLWVYIPGAAFVLAAIAFLTNKMVKTAAYLLAVLLFIFVLTIHLPNFLNGSDFENRQFAFINLLKDTAIAAFALHIASNSTN